MTAGVVVSPLLAAAVNGLCGALVLNGPPVPLPDGVDLTEGTIVEVDL